jgi:hypothetical protein
MLRFSPEISLLIIILASSLISFAAIVMKNNFNDYVSFYSFLLFAGIYYITFNYFIRETEEIKDV